MELGLGETASVLARSARAAGACIQSCGAWYWKSKMTSGVGDMFARETLL